MNALVSMDQAGDAAVMVMLLEDELASRLLAELTPEELRLIGQRMCEMGEIGPDAIAHAIAGFVAKTETLGLGSRDRSGQVRALMMRAVGEIKADNLMESILPEPRQASTLELARWLTPRALVPLVKGEHPQTIAVLLVQLDPAVAAEVLHSLPPEIQPEVVHRVATLGPVAPEALVMLEELLNQRISECHGLGTLTIGGPRDAAEIINNSGKAMEKHVMPEIAKKDRNLAKEIENEMFKFEHLFVLDPQSMGALLREVDSETLIDALKGVSEDEREHFFCAMSSRAADGVRDEIAARGRVKLDEVVKAQKAVVASARRLAGEGVIVFGSGDDEYV